MRKSVMVLVAAATLFGAAYASEANVAGPGTPPPGARHLSDGPDGFPAHLARLLELTEAQKKQIGSILNEQRDKGRAQMEKESELREQLRRLEMAPEFNEQAVRSAAAALASLETERVVARAKVHVRINAVLTPEQRVLAEKLRPKKDELPPPSGGCGPQGRGEHGLVGPPEWR